MKSSQKGFIVPFFVLIIALLAVGEGVYVYVQNKSEFVTPDRDVLPSLNTDGLVQQAPKGSQAPIINSVSPQTLYTSGSTGINEALVTITGENFSEVKVYLIDHATLNSVTTGIGADTTDGNLMSPTEFKIKIPNFVKPGVYDLVVENSESGLKGNSFSFTVASLPQLPQETVSVTKFRPAPDKIAPVVSIVSHVNENTVFGLVTISTRASDNVNVKKVQFYKNGALFSTIYSAPFSTSWDTKQEANETFIWSAKAYDPASNVGTSASVSLIVNNLALPISTLVPIPASDASTSLPALTLSVANKNIGYNTSTTLTWSSSGASSCTASNGWSGAQLLSGSKNTSNLTSSKTYALTCTGAGGSVTKSLRVVVGVAPDTTSPTITITAPANGATVSGATNILAVPYDNISITKVQFYKNGALFSTISSAPYSISWNTMSETNSTFTWTAKAYDTAGNIGTSAGVGLVVNNSIVPTSVPTLTFSIGDTDISYDTSTTLTWSSSGASSCTASGAWTGSQSVSGSQSTGNLTTSKTYTLSCTNLVGAVSKEVTVNVEAAPIVTNYLESAVVSQFNALIAGKTAPSFAGTPPYAPSIVNIFNPDGSRNSQIWTGNVNLTCIPQSIGQNGVLITKRDMIFANHYGYSNPTFMDNSGNTVSRTVVSSRAISNPVGDIDILVATLDEDVPASITPCVLAPSTIRSYSPGPDYSYHYPVVFTNKDRTLLIGELWWLGTVVYITRSVNNFSEWYYSVRGGDSGAPAFLLINGSLALLTNWHTVGAGPVDADNISQINDAITANGSPYAVSTFDLSEFTTY